MRPGRECPGYVSLVAAKTGKVLMASMRPGRECPGYPEQTFLMVVAGLLRFNEAGA